MFSSSLLPALCVFISVTLAALTLISVVLYVAERYHGRYVQEARTELDDVLIQIPANRVFDLSLTLSGVFGILSVLIVELTADVSLQTCVIVTVIVAVAAFPMPRLLLKQLKKRRLHKFNLQLEGALGMMSSSLKAGFSINQALDEIAEQDTHPIAVEFRLLTQEIRLGVPLEQALENMNRRLGSEDFELVTTAILTARQTGGELTATLERVAGLIRERVRISEKVRAQTAMGRLQAVIIGAMPFLLLFGIWHVSPDATAAFLDGPLGFIAMGVVVVLVTVGFLAIRKITTIEV